MKKSDCVYVGNLKKPHGIKGELSVEFELVFLKKFSRHKFLFVEIFPDDELVPFFIERAESDANGEGRIKFDDYNSIDEIRNLVNRKIYFPVDFLPQKIKTTVSIEDLIGFSVSDKKFGMLGIITDIYETTHQKTLALKKGEKEILIPFVNEFIIKTDKRSKTLFTKIPEGLSEL